MRPVRSLLLFVMALVLAAPALAGRLQEMVDAAEDGAVIVPPAGTYVGNLHITRPVEIDGSEGVVIDGGGQGTVVNIETSGVTLKHLTIRNSGRLHNKVDAGLRIAGNYNVVRDVRIENSLFGIEMTQASNNVLRRNYIGSKEMPLELRGDSVRIWYSNDNLFEQNVIEDSRDFVVWYSSGNKIQDNAVRRGRYGIHFMYAHENFVRRNEISDCVVGVFLMYANNTEVTENQILRAWGRRAPGSASRKAPAPWSPATISSATRPASISIPRPGTRIWRTASKTI